MRSKCELLQGRCVRRSGTAHRDPGGIAANALPARPMEVLFLTTLFSVLFAILFLLFFLRARQKSESCAQQDALLPFRDDPPAPRREDPTAAESALRETEAKRAASPGEDGAGNNAGAPADSAPSDTARF